MLILKIPKIVRMLRKAKHKWYSKGWKECTKEKDDFISTLRTERAKEIKNLTDELNDCRISHKEKYDRLKKESEIERLELKNSLEKRMEEIRKSAQDEVAKADEREEEYRILLAKLRTLFHEGAVKFLITAEEQESLMTSMAQTVHRKNQFLQLSTEFEKVVKDNTRTINTLNAKQLKDK